MDDIVERLTRIAAIAPNYCEPLMLEAADLIARLRAGADGWQGGEPVAWRVKDFADGWILFSDVWAARRESQQSGGVLQNLYTKHALSVAAAPPASPSASQPTFQERVQPWMMECFGPEISADKIERNHRFIEEALELVQSTGCTQSEAHQLVDYVYGRPQGDINQEVGGVMVTLAALCLANGFDMHAAGETELARVWTKIEKIRAKQAAKPRHSSLPEPAAPQSEEPDWHKALNDAGHLSTARKPRP